MLTRNAVAWFAGQPANGGLELRMDAGKAVDGETKKRELSKGEHCNLTRTKNPIGSRML